MPNRLAQQTSPYLQQHADNPVDWYPWGEEALRRARAEDKAILLSVGYSACHWCHVMAHESFEDPQIAAQMNALFVNIKVDREERPDIDQIYQLAHQMLTQRAGGWPLTMFLTPDAKPFFGGTYFPKTARYNLPGFGDLLVQVAQTYRDKKQQIAEQNQSLLVALQRTLPRPSAGDESLSPQPLETAIAQLRASFDQRFGGFGGAPKFPHAAEIELCLRRFAATQEFDLLHLATFTLERMIDGGIYDQLGGGFCRYSVDGEWSIPHFEKMLYDNGPLLKLLADAYAATGSAKFARAAEETAGWVMREMQAPDGGYYSTLDADSEHEEGKFYVWTPEAVRRLLTAEEYHVAALTWGLDGPPNFENAQWHLRVNRDIDLVAQQVDKPIAEADRLLQSASAKLFAARETRVRPGRDEKVLTSWNGLMIAGMARAGRVFGRDDWVRSAQRALAFVRHTLWRDGRLLATSKGGHAHLNAYLDDYAFMLAALIELMQTEYRSEDMAFARQLADVLLNAFEDTDAGGFHFTAHDHEALIHRIKSGYDNATPSGNGVAAQALNRLAFLCGDSRYRMAAERTLRLFWHDITAHASGHSTLLTALEETLRPPTLIVIRGAATQLAEWRAALGARYRPTTLTLLLADELAGLPEALDKPPRGAVNAWVCKGVSCLPPVDSPAALEAILESGDVA